LENKLNEPHAITLRNKFYKSHAITLEEQTIKITVISVGKIKEKFHKDAIAEFEKRLTKYCKLVIVEVEDEKTPNGVRDDGASKELILKKEGERILHHLKVDAHVIVLEINGLVMDSEKFANHIEKLAVGGNSHIQFVIGGSLGLHMSVLDKADLRLSFSAMTFPHQLMRIILLEQIYRAFRINHGEPYHK